MFTTNRSPVRALLLVLLAFSAACRGSPLDPGSRLLLAEIGGEVETLQQDPAEVLSARIEGDLLYVDVRFAGGCEEHAFSLLLSDVFRESFPVQTDLKLTHDARGDTCRALLTRSLVFDLQPLRDGYTAAYQTTSGSIALHLYAPTADHQHAQPLLYEF